MAGSAIPVHSTWCSLWLDLETKGIFLREMLQVTCGVKGQVDIFSNGVHVRKSLLDCSSLITEGSCKIYSSIFQLV